MERKTVIKALLTLVVFAVILLSGIVYAQTGSINKSDWLKIIDDTCIYDNNDHAAFTTMEEWNGILLVAFREGGAHHASDTDKGRIRVMQKKNRKWKTQYVFAKEGIDLRDPDIVRFGDKLFLYTLNMNYSELTKNGWTELKPIINNASYKPSIWKKRVHNGKMYGIGYYWERWPVLMESEDGINWDVVTEYRIGGNASEADICFVRDTMYICLRIDSPIGSNSMWGKSVYPYKECKWSMMDISVSSPEMIQHSENTILLAGRERDFHQNGGNNSTYVTLFVVDLDGNVKERYVVDKNSGDQGYPSFYKDNKGNYYMSYYAGQGQTSVRLLTFKVNRDFE